MTAVRTGTERAILRTATAAPERPAGKSTGWWGMMMFVCTEAMTFAGFLASYFYLRFDHGGPWPPAADKPPHLLFTSIGTAVLVASCAPMGVAVRVVAKGRSVVQGLMLVLTLCCGILFVGFQCIDYVQELSSGEKPTKDAYGSLLYMITGLHLIHVLLGFGMLAILIAGTLLGRIGPKRPEPVGIVALYWYFLAALALTIYLTVYVTPYVS